MNNQQAFDRVLAHNRKQRGLSADLATGKCKYRGPEGRMCFVGALVPESEVYLLEEGNCASSLVSKVPALKGLSYTMLDSIQEVHDRQMDREANPSDPLGEDLYFDRWDQEEVEAGLANVAERFELVYTPEAA